MINTFKKKLLVLFLTPVILAIVIGNAINISQLEDLSLNLTSLEFKTNSLDLIETISDIDRDARLVSRRILFNYLLDNHNDSISFQILSNELLKSKYASSVSLITIPDSGVISSYEVLLAMNDDRGIMNEKIYGGNFSKELVENIVTLMNTNTIYWTAKYSFKANDSTNYYSKFIPVYEEGKMTAIITVNIDVSGIARLIAKYPRNNDQHYYILSKSFEIIYSTAHAEKQKHDKSYSLIRQDSLIGIANTISSMKLQDVEIPDWFKINDISGNENIVYVTHASEPPLWFFYTAPHSTVINKAINKIYPTLIIDVVILVILLLVLLNFSNRLSRPIKAMQLAISHFIETGNKSNLEVNRSDELGLLAGDINFMQDELIRKDKELRKLEEAKTAFLKMISHEIRTPLNGILGSAYFLKETIDNKDLSEFVEMLSESAERLEILSQKALLITELKTRSNIAEEEINSFSDFLARKFRENEDLISSNKIEIMEGLEQKFNRVNSEMIWMAIKEIVDNTKKFANENSPIIIEHEPGEDSVRINFKNTGPQIPEDKISSLGKPFELAQEHYDKYTGLGLALVSMIMELHRGKFEILNSEDGVITSLIFRM